MPTQPPRLPAPRADERPLTPAEADLLRASLRVDLAVRVRRRRPELTVGELTVEVERLVRARLLARRLHLTLVQHVEGGQPDAAPGATPIPRSA